MKIKAIVILFCISFTLSSIAEEKWSNKGEVSFQWRRFEDDKTVESEDTGTLVFSRIESQYESGNIKNVFRGFARVDHKDSDRDFMALEDFYLSRFFGGNQDLQVLFGYRLYNWTATEAFHPADVVNSENFDSDLEFFEKLGEPAFEINKFFDWGTLSAFIWPRFENPQFPGNRSRLGFGIDFSRPQSVTGTNQGEDWVLQGGVRLTYTLDDGDLSFHLIHHVDRNFPLVGTTNYVFNPFLNQNIPLDITSLTVNPTPYYFRVTQAGGTLQYAFSNLILKFEGATRIFEDDLEVLTIEGLQAPVDHSEVALGAEYQLPINWGEGDTSVFLEGGGILGTTKEERARLSVFQRDVFLGLRHSFNDIMGSELMLTLIHDLERSNERLYNLSYSRRLSDQWKLKLGVRVYDAPIKGSIARGLENLDGSNHVLMTLTHYF